MVNKVTLIGYIGTDPVFEKVTDEKIPLLKFRLATNEKYFDSNEEWKTDVQWHSVVLWREFAKGAQKALKKGFLIYLEGRLVHNAWNDNEGNKHYTTEVVATGFKLLSKKVIKENAPS